MQAVIPHPYDQKRPTGRTADAQTVGLDDHTPRGLTLHFRQSYDPVPKGYHEFAYLSSR